MIFTLCNQVKALHDWTTEEKNSMRRLFEHGLRVWPSLVRCAHEAQGTLVYQATERKDYDWQVLVAFDLELVRMTDAGQMDEAVALMAEHLQRAMATYWPDCPLDSYKEFLTEYSRRRKSQTT